MSETQTQENPTSSAGALGEYFANCVSEGTDLRARECGFRLAQAFDEGASNILAIASQYALKVSLLRALKGEVPSEGLFVDSLIEAMSSLEIYETTADATAAAIDAGVVTKDQAVEIGLDKDESGFGQAFLDGQTFVIRLVQALKSDA